MNAETLAEWMKRQGHCVVQTSSSYWVEAGPRVYQAIPYHLLIAPSEEELNRFIREEKAIALRYSTPLDSPSGAYSYHVVRVPGDYTLEALPKKGRYDIRKGLGVAKVEQISFDRLAKEGWSLRLDTLLRQGRREAENQGWWEKLCRSAADLPGFETWAAIADGKLAATLIAFQCDNHWSVFYQQSLTTYLQQGVNHALTFEFTRNICARSEPADIFYGVHSLDAPSSVDEFKFRLGYMAKPVRQRVVFHPMLRPLINNATFSFYKGIKNILPYQSVLSKAEGLMRFYLQGKLPLDQQPLPPVLSQNDKQPA
jgi:hypothetical protein